MSGSLNFVRRKGLNNINDVTTQNHASMDLNSSAKRIWKQHTFLNCRFLYAKLLNLMINNSAFVSAVCDCCEPTDADALASFLVSTYNPLKKTLSLIKYLISNEFSRATNATKGSILRGNNIVCKIEGAYVKSIAYDYLCGLFKEILEILLQQNEISLEIDPSKLSKNNPENLIDVPEDEKTLQELLESQQLRLSSAAQFLLERLTDTQSIKEMPREIRAIAGYTASYAREYFPDSTYPLLGGFLMLRLFSPALIAPENWLPMQLNINATQRRNLTLLAKLLQNASNGTTFDSKEPYMIPMNSFINDSKSRMWNYFDLVASDPLSQGTDQPEWADFAENNEKSFIVNMENIKDFHLDTLFDLHRVVYNAKYKIIAELQRKKVSQSCETLFSEQSSPSSNERQPRSLILASSRANTPRSPKSNVSGDLERAIDILINLDPPPKFSKSSTKKVSDVKVEPEIDTDLSSFSGGTDSSGGHASVRFLEMFQLFQNARFLFQGPEDRKSTPIFYLIVQRLRLEFLSKYEMLMQYIFKVMDSAALSGPYSIVIDMSWANISAEMRNIIYRKMFHFHRAFPRPYKKNIRTIFIVHPNTFSKALTYLVKPFTSKKLNEKIVEIYNWKHLAQYIDPEKILLPESSRDFIAKSYNVIKVNSKGKRQERLIKFTLDSLLNIDPKTHRIQNEKKLWEIEEIILSAEGEELLLKFGDPVKYGTSNLNKKTGLLSTLHSPEDLLSRRYICRSSQDRESIIQDIFKAAFYKDDIQYKQNFKLIKVNNVGKHQQRTWRFTCDSLLNVDINDKIKSEIPFAGIEDVSCEPYDKTVLWIKFKAKSGKRQVICENGTDLFNALQAAIRRYQDDNEKCIRNEKFHAMASDEIL